MAKECPEARECEGISVKPWDEKDFTLDSWNHPLVVTPLADARDAPQL
jgi:hypothetical protein